jgi:hypothetical protein
LAAPVMIAIFPASLPIIALLLFLTCSHEMARHASFTSLAKIRRACRGYR